jgi:hypothetical protein
VANLPTRVILFLSSYAPLLVILAIRDSFQNIYVTLALLSVAALSVVILFVYFRQAQSLASDAFLVKAIISKDGEAMGYIVTYLLPFFDIHFNEPANAISLGLVFLVLGVLYINSNMIYTNPILNLGGYHIYEIESADGKKSSLITRRPYIRIGSELSAVQLGNYVLLEKRQ